MGLAQSGLGGGLWFIGLGRGAGVLRWHRIANGATEFRQRSEPWEDSETCRTTNLENREEDVNLGRAVGSPSQSSGRNGLAGSPPGTAPQPSSLRDRRLLCIADADRNHHPPPIPQLLDERSRDTLGGTGHDDGIEGSLLWPPLIAVTGPSPARSRNPPALAVPSPALPTRGQSRSSRPPPPVLTRSPPDTQTRVPISSTLSSGRNSKLAVINATMNGCEIVWP